MQELRFISEARDQVELFVRYWPTTARANVLIAHGAAEHGGRYARVAGALNAAGYGVYAIDHRGHGRTGQAATQGVFAAEDGWNRAVADLRQCAGIIRERHPGLPLVLFGHSMGSVMAQQFIAEYGHSIDAVVLSGSALIDGFAELIPLLEAEVAERGRDAPSVLMAQMMSGGFNAGIPDARTGFDWLSRDPAEVQLYIDDPWCGFDLSSGAWLDMTRNHRVPTRPGELAKIPRGLPVYVLAGDKDPLNQGLVVLHELLRRYAAAGLERVSSRFYAGGRHEMLNETNRDEVTADLIAWLEGVA